jgi:hypothetical protein
MDLDRAREAEREAKARLAQVEANREAQKTIYLAETPFDPADPSYEVKVDGLGVIVYSECCSERMSEDTARMLYEALGRYLDAQSTQAL